jgi:hypothetical protein
VPETIRRIWNVARANAQWLASPGLVWVTVVIFAGTLMYALWWPVAEERVAQAGSFLQLVGIGMGIGAWRATRKLFKMPSLTDEARSWIGRRPRNVTAQLAGISMAFTGGSAKLSVWADMGAELDATARIDALVANLEQLRKEAGESNAEHTAAVAKLRTDMESKTRAIEEGLSGATRTLRESQTGGLWAAWVALLMLFVGTALNGFPRLICWLG